MKHQNQSNINLNYAVSQLIFPKTILVEQINYKKYFREGEKRQRFPKSSDSVETVLLKSKLPITGL